MPQVHNRPRKRGKPIPLFRASLARRLASLLYEGVVVAAILLAASFASVHAATSRLEGLARALFQAYLLSVLGGYFVWCWCRGGQTLPMRAWRLRLVEPNGAPVKVPRAVLRYLLAAAAFAPVAVGSTALWMHPRAPLGWLALAPGTLALLWSLVDSERQFLHDRLAGTRIVSAAPPTTSSPSP
jgi:uncharacterized RDD family membrane protein YckC